MLVEQFVFLIFLLSSSRAAIFLWSNRQMRILPLLPFTSEELSKLVEELENPEMYVFRSSSTLSDRIKHITEGFYTAYTPNGDINPDNITDLSGTDELDLKKIQEVLGHHRQGNFISMILIPDRETRFKREQANITEVSEMDKTTQHIPKGPVIYKSQNTKTELYALLYSSQALLLRRNDTLDLHLGNTKDDMILYDNRLNVNIPMEDGRGKISLRFSFLESNGYWYMPSVRITETDTLRDYNLTTNEDIMASRNFSYHCNGVSIYSDSNGTELHIYDLQVQMDTPNGKFGDPYDCVPFITAPIWSGLLITTLLGMGLIVALTAIMDIKTMDKFENQKTKSLSITVSE